MLELRKETMEAKHAILPWKVGKREQYTNIHGYGQDVARCSTDNHLANAEFIVRACNSHYALLEALQDCVEYLSQCCLDDKEHWESAEKAITQATRQEG